MRQNASHIGLLAGQLWLAACTHARAPGGGQQTGMARPPEKRCRAVDAETFRGSKKPVH